ncbi:hypothetical protein VPH35_139552 [Triticum aestivum]
MWRSRVSRGLREAKAAAAAASRRFSTTSPSPLPPPVPPNPAPPPATPPSTPLPAPPTICSSPPLPSRLTRPRLAASSRSIDRGGGGASSHRHSTLEPSLLPRACPEP